MRRILVAAALLAAAALTPAADAAPALGRVELRSASPVAAELDLPAGTVPRDLRVTTSGSYAALVLANARTGDVHEFTMFVRDVPGPAGTELGRPRPLPAGRYRLALLTDGPAVASLSLGPSKATRRLTATRPVAATAANRVISPVGEARAAFVATGREYVMFAIGTTSDTLSADYLEICTVTAGGVCAAAAENYFTVGPGFDTGSRATMHGALHPAGLQRGTRYEFLEQYAGAGTTVHGFAVVATL